MRLEDHLLPIAKARESVSCLILKFVVGFNLSKGGPVADETSPERLLGEDPDGVALMIVDMVTKAHQDLAAASALGGRHSRHRMYGQIWAELQGQACELFDGTVTSITAHPDHAPYNLPVLHGAAIVIWRLPMSTSLRSPRYLTTTSRENVFRLPVPQPQLFDEVEAELDENTKEVDSVVAEAGRMHLPVVLIAVESTPDRLSRISWGVAHPGDDKRITLTGLSFLFDATKTATAIGKVSKTGGFASGPVPLRIVEQRDMADGDG